MANVSKELYRKRQIALRKFNNYFNSFADGNEHEISRNKEEICDLIEQIRTINRNLADDDDLYDEKLVQTFNSDAHSMSKFLNDSNITKDNIDLNELKLFEVNNNDNDMKLFYTQDDHIDTLLNDYYIDNLKLIDANDWFDYYPKMMEFIVRDKKIENESTRLLYLRKTLRYNAQALKSIENLDCIEKAVEILIKQFDFLSNDEKDTIVKKSIRTFHFSNFPGNDEQNFRELFMIALHIEHSVREKLKMDYFLMIVHKLPISLRVSTLRKLILMLRAKLRYYDSVFVLKKETFIEIKKLFERLIVDKQICPICYNLHEIVRMHPIVRCRNLFKFCDKYANHNNRATSSSLLNLSYNNYRQTNRNFRRSSNRFGSNRSIDNYDSYF